MQQRGIFDTFATAKGRIGKPDFQEVNSGERSKEYGQERP